MASVRVCCLLGACLVLLLAATASRAASDEPHDVADALRMLEELDRYYTQAARPRMERRAGSHYDPEIDRAVRLLQLQSLDRYYSYHSLPRYGKRSDVFANWAKEYEKGEAPSWLALVQRR